ncbi:hypothetical protein DQ04_05071040 [Trypanosoma grayi]|uniref:hypothetical protein n=1 Tax=Trypanosoma grayi TaxID=71804 RepID=UPI0004F4B26C|nr:hypothetical protein DQ04_05071040 [Trypanosoma grayi]KEG09533.1 hypothetical protein DQ04_05071040 [Trypanosoma grayi]
MAGGGGGGEGDMPNEEPFIANLLVDAVDDRFQKNRFNVEFAFLRDTTVETVLTDLEEALVGMGLRLAIPYNQCALAYDSSRNNSNINNTDIRDTLEEGLRTGDDGSIAVLSGKDYILEAPEVEAFYDLNRRCGLKRVAIFLVVRRSAGPLLTHGTSHALKEMSSSAADGEGTAAAKEVGGLEVYLLSRQLQFDQFPEALETSTNDNDEMSNDYQSALTRVRAMVNAEEKSILTARHQQQYPHREPHWSIQLNKPPSRLEWLKALEAEAESYDRLTAQFTQVTSAEVARQEKARAVLQEEVTKLHGRIDSAKVNVTKRQVLQDRVEELKMEIEAQREKEQELLQALEKVKVKEVRDRSPPGPPPTSSVLLARQDGRISSQHRTPVTHEPVPNYSAIHGSSAGAAAGGGGGSNFLSPSLSEEVRRALSPRAASPLSAQQQKQQQQQTDLQRLRHLAAELSHHLRSQNPNPAERHRLMEEIRRLRQQVEQRQAEESRVTVTPLRWRGTDGAP